MRRLRARYGAGPAHLLATLASFLIAAAAVIGWTQRPRDLLTVLIWFAAAIVLHDMVLLPVYSIADRLTLGRLPGEDRRVRARSGTGQRARAGRRVPDRARLRGHIRSTMPAAIVEHGYLARWLLLCGGLFALSGLAFAVRGVRAGR